MKNLLFAFIIFVSFNFNQAKAADSSSGCGPGWYIAKESSLLSSALRLTTNVVLFPSVTLGMTFGTSNCTKHSIVKNEMESLKFATENYFELAADSVKGQGQFLSAFATTMGCDQAVIPTFNQKMKKHFNKTFNLHKSNAKELIINTYKVILEDKDLIQSCIVS